MQATKLEQSIIDKFVGVCHGDLATVKQMLAERADLLTVRATWDESPLGAAGHVGNVEIARFLLDQGAPLEICVAAMLGDADFVKAQITADLTNGNALGPHGIGILAHAVLGGHTELAHYLLAHGADINAGAGVMTALHAAIAFGRRDLAAWLLKQGADLDAANFQQKTARDLMRDNPTLSDLVS